MWTVALEDDDNRTYDPRDYIWATELGKPFVDVFLRMKGEQPSNPPNGRSRRKFEAGNIWEWIIKIILIRAGILQTYQERVEFTYPETVRVSGKMDFVAGGKPDWESAKAQLESLELPERTMKAAEKIIKYLQEKYPEGLGSKPLELKSLSANMYNVLENTGRALKIHRLQVFHQLKGCGLPVGDIVYISRDDCRMMSIPVHLADAVIEQEYKTYIETITGYYRRDEQPPLADCVVFDEDMLKFSKNNQVAWSSYLTKLYGIADQAEFDDKYKPVAERWNRVIGRMKKGANMTDKNLAAIEEMKEAGFDPEEAVKRAVVSEEEEAANAV